MMLWLIYTLFVEREFLRKLLETLERERGSSRERGMDRVYEKEKSSRKTRDERERDKESSKDHHRDHRDRDRDREHKHRSSRDGRSRDSVERHHSDKYREEKHSSKEEKHRDNDRHRSKDYSYDHEESKRERSHEPTIERESSRDEREESVERRSLSSHKRKERGDSEERFDKSEKRVRASKEEKREKRKFEDKGVEDSRDLNGTGKEGKKEKRKFEDGNKEEAMRDGREEKRERRRFGDKAKEEDVKVVDEERENKQVVDERADANNVQSNVPANGSGSIANDAALEPLQMTSRVVQETYSATDHPPPTKVSSISTTNENKGVSITRSHEVPGKSSTDGTTTSAATKSGNLSLEALEKAKKALQMQKKLSEKLKKIPLLNKVTTPSSDATSSLGLDKEGPKAPASSVGVQHGSMAPTTVQPSTSTLPVGAASSVKPSGSGMATLPGLANVPNYEAVKRAQELAAKMGFHQDPEFAPLINMFPGQAPVEVSVQQKPAKAPVLRLDALGREIDEHGNVINMPKLTNLSTLKVNINKQKKDAFQILKPELDVDPESNPHYDERMGINKTKLLRPKRMSFQFVEEGSWSKQADHIRFKSQFGEAQAKELKTKQAQLAKAKAEPDINPNLIEVSERVITAKEKPKDPIPEVEWWDVLLLPSGNYGDITGDSITEDRLKMEKITIYVEHPLPIEPPAEPAPPPPQPLKLTKQEQKKLRTQRRLAKEKDRQEMIRQGLLEPPKPKIKMSNLMKVLGSEATQDPTRLEMEIRSAAAEREQAHVDRNIARKLTPAERREKKEKKLFDDPSTLETIVSVYKINDLSHRQTRWKVDVNAQENRLTGCAVIADGISVVVVEGGSKAIKRYGKLMLRRINWAAAVANEEENEDEDEDKPENKCVLVWQGSVARPSFNRFFIHECRTEAAARKYFSDAGVGHYWDLAVNFSDDQI
ncbi:protein of unknown function DUF1115 [Macleaya cordata]|uniref:Pre-mRNA processing factor 3 n=1 Tax=Macleaya cordata TaxID=56857 RepID=A0A200QPR9_MACCD|nr:protein of unknown function DUF1115 [Macleaya cordata]